MTTVLDLELYDVWSIEFIGLFVSPDGMMYILVVFDSISK